MVSSGPFQRRTLQGKMQQKRADSTGTADWKLPEQARSHQVYSKISCISFPRACLTWRADTLFALQPRSVRVLRLVTASLLLAATGLIGGLSWRQVRGSETDKVRTCGASPTPTGWGRLLNTARRPFLRDRSGTRSTRRLSDESTAPSLRASRRESRLPRAWPRSSSSPLRAPGRCSCILSSTCAHRHRQWAPKSTRHRRLFARPYSAFSLQPARLLTRRRRRPLQAFCKDVSSTINAAIMSIGTFVRRSEVEVRHRLKLRVVGTRWLPLAPLRAGPLHLPIRRLARILRAAGASARPHRALPRARPPLLPRQS